MLNMHDFFFFFTDSLISLAHNWPYLFKVCSWVNVGIATPVSASAQCRVRAYPALSLGSFGMTSTPHPPRPPHSTTHLLSVTRVWFAFLESSIRWNPWHGLFFIWLLWLRVVIGRSIQIAGCISRWTTFSHTSHASANPFSSWGTFWWLPFSMTNGLLHTCVSFCRHRFLFLSGKHLRAAWLGHMVTLWFIFGELPNRFQGTVPFLYFYQGHVSSSLLIFLKVHKKSVNTVSYRKKKYFNSEI